ncbi:hypothetical protein [Psittacicella hinzii]|uniref:Uncharacterized protein n=1 Tax=Psittacicella hinzii TaxID=2028575 RepID=A0A3A1YRY2_9GAMM|nr:hypothetical protein [Psittacicella hinzii]RIY39134.1 hypothetical protein CKF58_02795 [Psittacicella hinzii]
MFSTKLSQLTLTRKSWQQALALALCLAPSISAWANPLATTSKPNTAPNLLEQARKAQQNPQTHGEIKPANSEQVAKSRAANLTSNLNGDISQSATKFLSLAKYNPAFVNVLVDLIKEQINTYADEGKVSRTKLRDGILMRISQYALPVVKDGKYINPGVNYVTALMNSCHEYGWFRSRGDKLTNETTQSEIDSKCIPLYSLYVLYPQGINAFRTDMYFADQMYLWQLAQTQKIAAPQSQVLKLMQQTDSLLQSNDFKALSKYLSFKFVDPRDSNIDYYQKEAMVNFFLQQYKLQLELDPNNKNFSPYLDAELFK